MMSEALLQKLITYFTVYIEIIGYVFYCFHQFVIQFWILDAVKIFFIEYVFNKILTKYLKKKIQITNVQNFSESLIAYISKILFDSQALISKIKYFMR